MTINPSLHIQWPYSSGRSHISPMKSVLWVISSKGKGNSALSLNFDYGFFFGWKAFLSGCHIEEPSDYLASSTTCLLLSETSPPFRMSQAKWWKLLVTFENMALWHCLWVRMTRKAARWGLALGGWRKEVHGTCSAPVLFKCFLSWVFLGKQRKFKFLV